MWPLPYPRQFAGTLLASAIGCALFAFTAAAELVEQDQTFVSAASASNRAEIKLSDLAVKKAKDKEVKRFAQELVEEHRRMGDELAGFLEEMKVEISEEPTAQTKARMDRLSDLSGDSFDREYMKIMVKSHDKAVAVFADQSEAGESEPLKEFAATHLPTLREHLDRALTLDGKLSVATQTPPTDPLQSQAEAHEDAAEIEPDKPIAQRTAADVIQLPVFTEGGEMVGNVKEVVLDQTSRTCYAIIPFGGTLAIGERDIAVECNTLRHKADEDPKGALVVAATQDQLKSLPEVDISDTRYVRYPDDRKLGEFGAF